MECGQRYPCQRAIFIKRSVTRKNNHVPLPREHFWTPWRSHSAAVATWERTLGLSAPGHNYPTLMTMTQHDRSFSNCGTGPPWWQQSINSLDTKYSTFKWSSTWPWQEKTAKTLQHDNPCFIWMHTATSWKSTASLDEHEIITSNHYGNLCLWKQEELD